MAKNTYANPVFYMTLLIGSAVVCALIIAHNASQITITTDAQDEVDQFSASLVCAGNRDAECVRVPAIDIFPTNSDNQSNSALIPEGALKEISGRIITIDGKQVIIDTTSTIDFTI